MESPFILLNSCILILSVAASELTEGPSDGHRRCSQLRGFTNVAAVRVSGHMPWVDLLEYIFRESSTGIVVVSKDVFI